MFCIIFDRVTFHCLYQLMFIITLAEKNDEKLVNQKICKTLKHCTVQIMNALYLCKQKLTCSEVGVLGG